MKTKTDRRSFLKIIGFSSIALTIPKIFSACRKADAKPNILWITSEDNSPFLGCYGDDFATTPNLNKLASEGILYGNAFATAPVCAPARNSLITGVYPPSSGTQHMRSRYPIPKNIQPYPLYLRELGYYCTNNSKTDYNFLGDDKSYWDECSNTAHYKNRAENQPFFAIFNFDITHESRIHDITPTPELRHDPAKVKLPPYHPDTPEIRHDWAQYYDKVEDLDTQVGELLKELDDDGLKDDTIVFYYSDHGGVLTRSKRFIYDSGLRVPMIIRFPEKYRYLATNDPGTRTDRLVSFIDLPPTLLSLTGKTKPDQMQGHAFLGKEIAGPRHYAFGFRGRMDEYYDFSRTVRDKEFRYIKNYMPHRIYGQHVSYLWRAAVTRSWEKEYKAGRCNAVQSRFWEPKPAEELYHTASDPWEVVQLTDDPQFKAKLEELRNACRDYMLKIRDSGFIPEGEMVEINKNGTVYDFVRSDEYDLQRIMDMAEKASSRNPEYFDQLISACNDNDKFIRYWAVTGLLILKDDAKSATSQLIGRLNDHSGDVRVTAAEALCTLGNLNTGLPALITELKNENTKVALHAANAIEYVGISNKDVLNALKAQLENPDDYIKRAVTTTIQKFEGEL